MPRDANGQVAIPIEISPLRALAAEDLKLPAGWKLEGATYLE